MEILDYVIIIGTSLIMFDKSTSKNLPIFSFQKILDFLFILRRLLIVPLFEESHFTVHERSVRLLTSFTISFSMLFTFRKNSNNSIEDFFYWVEPIASKVRHDIALVGFRIIITLKIENPISIEMRVHRHMKSIRILSDLISWAVLIMAWTVTTIITCECIG